MVEREWQLVAQDLPAALLSVWGTSDSDVWVVGGDAGDGPTVLHYDGAAWTRLETGEAGNLWWVYGFAGGPVYMGGDGGMLLRYDGDTFTKMTTPGTDTVFGIWGATPDDVWAVGGSETGATNAFAWRLQGGGDTWALAEGFPTEIAETDAMWKVYGRSPDDAWMVGTNGKAVRWDGQALTAANTGSGESLFTVHADADGFVAVGGFGTAAIRENDGADWVEGGAPPVPSLIGVCLDAHGSYAVGTEGTVLRREPGTTEWVEEDHGFLLNESFHSVWVSPTGQTWIVGGQVQQFPLIDGIMLHEGTTVSEEIP